MSNKRYVGFLCLAPDERLLLLCARHSLRCLVTCEDVLFSPLEVYNVHCKLLVFGQEELPNDRKVSKLCDYASKNPLRIPKVGKAFSSTPSVEFVCAL